MGKPEIKGRQAPIQGSILEKHIHCLPRKGGNILNVSDGSHFGFFVFLGKNCFETESQIKVENVIGGFYWGQQFVFSTIKAVT